jgi:peptidoglycan DL-endopeptidase CwlO
VASLRTRRRLVGVAIAGLAASIASIVMPAGAGAAPRPTLVEVQRQVDALHHEAEVSSEAMNSAQVQLDAVNARMSALKATADRQLQVVADLQKHLGSFAAAQYRTSGLGETVQLIFSDSPEDLAQGLATVNALGLHEQAQLRRVLAARQQLADDQAAVAAQARQAKTIKDQLAAQRRTLMGRMAAAEALLAQLTAEQRAQLAAQQRAQARASRSASRTPITYTGPVSGRAAIAVKTAYAQLGDPYVYGASGPSAFDCSGLTMYSWAAAGVYLPHSSSAQYGYGRHVSRSELQPGDLVFFYSPISHVGIYIGGGRIIHAPYPGRSVEIAPISEMPYSGATRL